MTSTKSKKPTSVVFYNTVKDGVKWLDAFKSLDGVFSKSDKVNNNSWSPSKYGNFKDGSSVKLSNLHSADDFFMVAYDKDGNAIA